MNYTALPIDLFIITYNRKTKLLKTLMNVFGRSSPIKSGYRITILDNCSDDGTSELIEYYKELHPQIRHVRHRVNIGGNANIIEALRLAKKKYFWILCDDDDYNWDAWDEVEYAVTNSYDVIVTKRLYQSRNIPPEILINELTFVPAAIYRTKLVTSDVIQSAYVNLYTSFPHLSLICKLFNSKNIKFYILKNTIVSQGGHMEVSDYTRGVKKNNVHPRQRHVNLMLGYVLSYQMLRDKKFKNKCINNLWIGKSFLFSAVEYINQNRKYLPNVFEFFMHLTILQKIQYLFALVYVYFLPKFYCRNKWICINFLGIKTKIFPIINLFKKNVILNIQNITPYEEKKELKESTEKKDKIDIIL